MLQKPMPDDLIEMTLGTNLTPSVGVEAPLSKNITTFLIKPLGCCKCFQVRRRGPLSDGSSDALHRR